MDGAQCKVLRQKLRIRQVVLAWDCQIDQSTLSKWEAGVARLRPIQVETIRTYLAQRLLAVKAEFCELELPELDAAIETVSR